MKRFSIALVTLIAAFAIVFTTGSATAGAAQGDQTAQVAKKKKKKKKIPLTITFNFQSVTPQGPYSEGSSSYSGQLSARKAVCFANRTVTVLRDGVPMFTVVTGSNGIYQRTFNSPAPPGDYTAAVGRQAFKKKAKKGKKKKKIVCLAAATAPPIPNHP